MFKTSPGPRVSFSCQGSSFEGKDVDSEAAVNSRLVMLITFDVIGGSAAKAAIEKDKTNKKAPKKTAFGSKK